MIFHALILLTLKKRNAWLASTKSKPNETSKGYETLDESESEQDDEEQNGLCWCRRVYYRMS